MDGILIFEKGQINDFPLFLKFVRDFWDTLYISSFFRLLGLQTNYQFVSK